MKVEPNAEGVARLHARNDAAAKGGLEDVRDELANQSARRSGEYAGSLRVDYADGHGVLYSPLPQAGAVERGADVGPRRGPHMRGQHLIARLGPTWPAKVTARLRGARG